VHLLIIGHVAQWLLQGITVSPVEPSEGMELAKHGVINTGLVFFAVAIVATAIFGRFFCGWGCHLIALQDLSRWLLLKAGLRPRPLRSRLLGLVPLVALVYMFFWPAIFKIAAGEPLGPIRTAFTTSEFWATFPGLIVAVLTFVICGFVVVFILGSKGYCSYGCPYGAAFGLADRLAPIRVRVTDACRSCATCTSVCTSNVRVHEEVRDHGMVVDPGCMKCLDCVAGCPNQALFVGAGAPAVGRSPGRSGSGRLEWKEELLGAAVFIAGFLAFRGLYGAVPFLLSLGIGAGLAGMAVASWRLMSRSDSWLGPLRLRAAGRIRRSGRFFVAVVAVVIIGWVFAAAGQLLDRDAKRRDRDIADLKLAALEMAEDPASMPEADRRRVRAARDAAERVVRWSPVERPDLALQRAWLAFLDQDLAAAEALLNDAGRAQPGLPEVALLAGRVMASAGRLQDAAAAYGRVIELDPDDPNGFLGLGTVLAGGGRIDRALEVFARGLRRQPDSADLRYNLALSHALLGDTDAAVAEFRRVLEVQPDHRKARENLAGVLAAAGRFTESVVVFEEAVRRSPDDPELRLMAARACIAAGDRGRAAEHIEIAVLLDPSLSEARRLLD
jgi:tetratricopeptide (TPR) repeat protein